MKKIKQFIILFLILTITFSCSKKDEKPTAERAYINAQKLLKDKDYSQAAKEFEKIEDDYPFSKWASKAQTMAAYAFYKNKDYTEVIRVVDDFIRVNPSHNSIAYMIYIKGLSFYEQIPDITRAQDNTKAAYGVFRELIIRFPDSEYSKDGNEKMSVINEHLAGSKMHVGRYQQWQENYIGAIKNFQEVIQRFQFTEQAPEAYYRLIEIHYHLGIKKEAHKILQQLSENFPDNEWQKKAVKLALKHD